MLPPAHAGMREGGCIAANGEDASMVVLYIRCFCSRLVEVDIRVRKLRVAIIKSQSSKLAVVKAATCVY